jgi:FKBP-type peptidyl-prolyl cis-trans isomerase
MTETAKSGDMVEVDYKGSFENGEVFDSSEGGDPLMFQLGAGQVIAGFDRAVEGMAVGESKTVTIPPAEAYGESGSHPLAGKTLIFEITLVGINPPA